MISVLFGLAAAISTYLGGRFALKYKDKLHLILGFSAGAVLGVAFFDLMPEAVSLMSEGGRPISLATAVIAAGFLLFMIVNQVVLLHPHTEEEHCENKQHQARIGAASLSIHSLLDGIAIGLAFQVSEVIGAVVAAAVLAHDFSDGINTVSVVLKGRGESSAAKRWLAVDALAPLVGVIFTRFFALPHEGLGFVLALFCGFFLYIGASDLLPESHHRHPRLATTIATVAGVAVLYLAVNLARL